MLGASNGSALPASLLANNNNNNNNDMVRRCLFGCQPPATLYRFPKSPALRSRWLEFIHFEESGVSDNTRLCVRHFALSCFSNYTEHRMGFAALALTEAAVPSLYTVGASPPVKPETRDAACQCAPTMKSASVEVYLVPKKKIRSKAIQVRLLEDAAPLGSGSSAEPRPHLRLVKRPRTTSLSPVTHHPCCRGNHGPSTHTPDTKREEHSYAIQTPNVIVCKTEASSPSSSPPSSPGCSGFPSVPSVRGDTPMEEEEEDKEEEEKSAMLVFAQVEVSIDGDDVVSDLEEDITDMSSSVEDVTEDEEEEEDVTEDKERGLEEADRGDPVCLQVLSNWNGNIGKEEKVDDVSEVQAWTLQSWSSESTMPLEKKTRHRLSVS